MSKVCERCGDPECTCPEGECKCTPKAAKTQPSDKFLPKQNKDDIKDGFLIGTAVNPYKPRTCPMQGETHAELEKRAGTSLTSLAEEEIVKQGVQNIQEYFAYAQENANELNKFSFGQCFVSRAKDGYYDIRYQYSMEHIQPFATHSQFGNEERKFQSSVFKQHDFIVSRHRDEVSARLACSDYNIFLAVKPARADHPVLKLRK